MKHQLFKNIIVLFGLVILTTLSINYLAAQTICADNSMALTDGQTFVVPAGVSEVFIEVNGARGGEGNNAVTNFPGGGGANVVGTFSVIPGDNLLAIVGLGGTNGTFPGVNNIGGGGGGGSALINTTTSEVLIVAGGGAGAGRTAVGFANSLGGITFVNNNGMINGTGGAAGVGLNGAGGGGGFNGTGVTNSTAGGGGAGLLTGAGAGGIEGIGGIHGGAGFGGGGAPSSGGGGGGGFNGGAGGLGNTVTLDYEAGIGGASFYNNVRAVGTPTNTAGSNAGNGTVRVCWTSAPVTPADPIPTMSQWGLLIFGLLILNLGIVLIYRRKLNM